MSLELPEFCTVMTWPAWASSWTECGSLVEHGRCLDWGHKQRVRAS